MSKEQAIADATSETVPDWDEYFSEIAFAVSKKSKDHCRVGAVIIHPEAKLILSTGYNGLPRNVLDKPNRIKDKNEKLSWTCHAETNAILNMARFGTPTDGAHIYVTKFPCVQCAIAITQANIKRVYTLDKGAWGNDPLDDGEAGRALKIFSEAGVQVHTPNFEDPSKRNYKGQSSKKAHHLKPAPLKDPT